VASQNFILVRVAKRPFHRRTFDASDEARTDAHDRPRSFHLDEPFPKLLVHCPIFEPGEMGTETNMFSAPESDVVVWPAVDAKIEGIIKNVFVSIS